MLGDSEVNSSRRNWLSELAVWGSLVKFSHSIFAAPFALAMFVLVARDYPVTAMQLFWILIALVSARTAAMSFNRVVDSDFDSANPRTKCRELPANKVSRQSVWLLVWISSILFLGSSWALGRHCLVMAPIVLGVLFLYSLTKRFTSTAHLFLGLALACAPGGVWYALVGTFAMTPAWLMLAVLFWVSGFDIIYACQDVEFDRTHQLRSIPAQLGVTRALQVSKLLHVLAVLFLTIFGFEMQVGWIYFVGVAVFAWLLISQHRIVSPQDLSRADAAFFTKNGLASALFFVFVLVDSCWR